MSDSRSSSPPKGDKGQVLRFRRGPAGSHRPLAGSSPVADLARFERDAQPDDYRHRMMVNAAALVFVAGLVTAGIWLAETLAQMRRNQDCALQGRHNCAPVEVVKGRLEPAR